MTMMPFYLFYRSLPSILAVLTLSAAPAIADDAKGRELIQDPRFRQGFKLLAPEPGKKVPAGTLQWTQSAKPPIWEMAQWSSKFSLEGIRPDRLPDTAVRYANPGKTVLIPKTGSPDGDLVLAVNAAAEYGDRPRQKGQKWPHLLVEQRFPNPPSISDVDRIMFHIAVRLRKSEQHHLDRYTPNLHAAQFLFFLVVQNLNRDSAGFGDFLYFGVPLYDSRHRIPKSHQNPDAAGKFIFTPPGEVYTRQSVHDRQWVTVHRDLKPLILEGLRTAWSRDHLTDSKKLADYRIAGMNLGWELPGTFNVEIQLKHLSLKTFTNN